jgi:hypothetical protein
MHGVCGNNIVHFSRKTVANTPGFFAISKTSSVLALGQGAPLHETYNMSNGVHAVHKLCHGVGQASHGKNTTNSGF